jgi:hypothetical protein
MLSMTNIDGEQYGVGFPVDMPVMLCYFEGRELIPVRPDFNDYDHLVNHVSMQMEDNDFQMFKTPVTLTLQGEFEDEELNQVVHGMDNIWAEAGFGGYDDDEEGNEDDNGDEDKENEVGELTLEEVMRIESIDGDYDDEDDDDDDDYDDDSGGMDQEVGGENVASFWNSAPTGRLSAELQGLDDVTIRGKGDMSNVPEDSIVSDEDTKALKRAHHRADRIMEYADDLKLIASFHYRKRNFHLVKLLDPIFIVGKRIEGIKGYYFTLLPDDEAVRVTPQIETLIKSQGNDPKRFAEVGTKGSGDEFRGDSGDAGAAQTIQAADANASVRRSRRKWSKRIKGDKDSHS